MQRSPYQGEARRDYINHPSPLLEKEGTGTSEARGLFLLSLQGERIKVRGGSMLLLVKGAGGILFLNLFP